MRIYNRIIVLSLSLSVLPLLLVAGIFYFNTQKDLKDAIYQRLDVVSLLKQSKVESFFNSRLEDLKAMEGFLDVRTNLPTLQEFDHERYSLAYTRAQLQLQEQLRPSMNSYAYADILLLDAKGKAVFVANPDHTANYFDRILFNTAVLQKAQLNIYFDGPFASMDWKYPHVLYMISKAVDTNNHFTGYIVLVVDMNVVYSMISDNTGLGATGETFLLKKLKSGEFLYISPLLYDYNAIFHKHVAANPVFGLTAKSTDYFGHNVLEVWQQIHLPRWDLVTKINREEILKPISSIRTMFFIICFLILTVVLMGAVLFAESVLDPIQKLQAMAVLDPLTGVLNRRGLQEVLNTIYAVSQRKGINVQILLLDLDDFKQVNDLYGHGMGDAILVDMTAKIRQSVRQTDYIARVGGDEFMVVLFDTGEADAVMVGDKIRKAISAISQGGPLGETIRVTCSIGMVPLKRKPASIDALLQELHDSLHYSKSQGKNRVTYARS